MTDANSQSNQGANEEGNQGGEANQGNSNGGGAQGQGPENNTDNSQIDLKNLTAEQVAQALESNAVWQNPRIKGLLDSQKEFKKTQEAAEKQQEEDLKEQNKYKDLVDKKDAQITDLQKRLEQQTINQAITNKLAPLGVVDLEAALALIDKGEITVDENGAISGVDKAIEALKTGKSYLFNTDGAGSVGSATNDNGAGTAGKAKFKRSQLKDPAFYNEHRDEILAAQKAGLIEDDLK